MREWLSYGLPVTPARLPSNQRRPSIFGEEIIMDEAEVRSRAFAMPLTSPAFPPGPSRFVNREFFIVTYRTDPEALKAVIPAPLEMIDPIVKFEFIRMPDSSGFGDFTESGQVIPVRYKDQLGGYVHAMYLNDHPPIAGGREIWGFPKKLGYPELRVEKETLQGVLRFGSLPIAVATMGYKYRPVSHDKVLASLSAPNFLIKIIPHVDCTPRICELVRYYLEDVTVKGAWEGPADIELFRHALAPVAALPVREVISGVHIMTDLTLGLGEVVHDYLKQG
jgi:acetoacetate decarboxylase